LGLNQPYFIVVLAHSLHGRLRRIHVPYFFVYVVLALALFGGVSLVGLAGSYLRMSLKVANYNSLRQEFDTLRARYQRLEKESTQKGVQLASLQMLATEVSVAYGLKRDTSEGRSALAAESRLIPTVSETLEEYNFLRSANIGKHARRSNPLFQGTNTMPGIWPVEGRLMSNFGHRSDPFSGDGAFHTGVDISVPSGTPVKAAADGIVAQADWSGAYGRLIIVDHGNGFRTYYAHLSRFDVVPGQYIRRGETVGRSGATGRVTAPHLHYEVRRGGAAINPHTYLRTTLARAESRRDYGF
jgi:murein DD-endopeptidase MepM/ murein hydrolase activator NlpD